MSPRPEPSGPPGPPDADRPQHKDAASASEKEGKKMNRKMKRLILPIGAAAIIGTSGFAYMASGPGPDTTLGQAKGNAVAPNIANVHYLTYERDGGTLVNGAVVTTKNLVSPVNSHFVTIKGDAKNIYSCGESTAQTHTLTCGGTTQSASDFGLKNIDHYELRSAQ
jgi:hypothetical protein